jgi:hypothetical protein
MISYIFQLPFLWVGELLNYLHIFWYLILFQNLEFQKITFPSWLMPHLKKHNTVAE